MDREQHRQHHRHLQDNMNRRPLADTYTGGKQMLVKVLLVALCLQQQVADSAPRQIQQSSSTNNQHHQLQATSGQPATGSYFGSPIGNLVRHSHNISGMVYAVDEQTLFIRAFNFDGQAQDAYFWSGSAPSGPQQEGGFIVPDEKGSTKPLERYQDKDLVLRLPEGKTLREIAWLSVWSRQTRQNLAHISISAGQPTPRPLEIAPFSQLAHELRSGPITIVDAQTFLVSDFHYDGLGPAAYFWLTRGGSGLSQSGLRLKDENGSSAPLRKYSGETVVISLPDELTIHDFDYFGVWCTEFQVNFGQTRIPKQAKVPPSPKMLGIKPENKLNCEILYDELGYEIRWVLDGDDIVMQLVGKIEPNEYMAFGLGKDDSRSDMDRADAVVAWVERQSGQVHAVDYYLGGKQQCTNVPAGASLEQASCPDVKLPGGGDSLTLLHGAIVNGYSMVTFKRPQLGVDEQFDQHVYSDGQQSVLWAIGTLNSKQEVGYHRLRAQQNMFIDFARNPQWNCPIPDLNASMGGAASTTTLPSVLGAASQLDPTVVPSSRAEPVSPAPTPKESTGWFVPSIMCPADRTFHAQIGPTAARPSGRGLDAQSRVSWYINGLLLPELVVERGQSYRFVVEGGNDKTGLSRRHPLYITDSPEGGFDFKTDEERTKERPLAGVALRGDGQFVPTAEGRLCEWRPTNQSQTADQFATFASYQRSLRLDCQPGQPATLKFSPDAQTPDLVYYQCYTNRFMGWRIRVVDSCQAYLSTLSRTSRAIQDNKKLSNQNKRDIRERRNTYSTLTMEPVTAMSETRFSVETAPFRSQQFVDFPEDPQTSGSSVFNSGDMLTSLPPDALILNNSQLHQSQPMNLTSFEQILKLSPADLEFLPENPSPQQQPEPPIEFQLQSDPNAIPFHFVANELQTANAKQQKATQAKAPKTLQSYMRRLASIYYPVQQQLSSMLTLTGNSSSPSQQVNKNNQQQQTASSEQSSSFSLASLVPKSKIDLSKAGISKKLNKLRFKSGRKYEPTPAASGPKQHSQPPTPSNEFNYDIFNNQLAQLELQQKQYQALERDHLWSSSTGGSMVGSNPAASDFLSPEEQQLQQAVEHSIGPQQMMFSNILQQQPSNLQQQQRPLKQPIRMSETPLGPPNQFGQQPYVIDYLSMLFNSSRVPSGEQQPMMVSQQQPHHQRVIYQDNTHRPQYPAPQQQQQHYNLQQPQSQQQAVYITRLPIAHGSYQIPGRPIYLNEVQRQPSNNWQEAQAARYPNIQPYNGISQQQPADSSQSSNYRGLHLSTMPSVSQTTHESQQTDYQSIGNSAVGSQNEVESLSGSGSGAYYDFRQQPTVKDQQAPGQADSDHMLAIERFSKQSSERRAPSIVHPITGEQVLSSSMANQHHYRHQQQQQATANGSTNDQQPRRYSSMLADNHLMDPSSEPTPVLTGDLLDMDSLIQVGQAQPLSSDSDKYNQTETPITYSRQQATTEPSNTSAVLVKPESYLHTGNDILTSTVASVTSTVGPLVPSTGPPTFSSPSQSRYDNVYRSTLLEPLSKPSTLQPSSFQNHPLTQFSLDTNPFIPIELTNPSGYYPSNIQLRPSPFIENMISQHQSQFKPEPPVQVASYLTNHLAIHGPMVVSSERSVASNQPVALSISLPSSTDSAASTNATSHHNDLIILKPTGLSNKQQAVQTYLLRPEYLTTSQVKSGDERTSQQGHHQDQFYPARRLASHQFDRLSSLSSPPSTSIALDPLQTANSIVTSSYLFKQQPNNSIGEPAVSAAVDQRPVQTKNASSSAVQSSDQLSQHRQSPLPIPMTMSFQEIQPGSLSSQQQNTASQQEVGVRMNQSVNSSKPFDRDNSTDNAILSHVMSLISANAIPSPPLIPVGGYSRADYFLPISDRLQRSTRGSL